MADRGLFSESNLSFFEGLKKRLKGEYILSCPLRKLSHQHKEKILDRDNYSGGNLLEEKSYYEFRYKRRRVVVSYSEKRKKQDQSKREKILDKLRSLEREKEISTAQLVKKKGQFDLTPIFRTLLFMTLGASFLIFINHKLVLN